MNKNGFTLIEILGSIVILSVIALISTPLVSKMISQSKDNLNDIQLKTIKDAAKTYAMDRVFTDCACPSGTSEMVVCSPKVSDLVDNGYIDKSEDSSDFKDKYGSLKIDVICKNNKYTVGDPK